jgi:hypothetical protein
VRLLLGLTLLLMLRHCGIYAHLLLLLLLLPVDQPRLRQLSRPSRVLLLLLLQGLRSRVRHVRLHQP